MMMTHGGLPPAKYLYWIRDDRPMTLKSAHSLCSCCSCCAQLSTTTTSTGSHSSKETKMENPRFVVPIFFVASRSPTTTFRLSYILLPLERELRMSLLVSSIRVLRVEHRQVRPHNTQRGIERFSGYKPHDHSVLHGRSLSLSCCIYR